MSHPTVVATGLSFDFLHQHKLQYSSIGVQEPPQHHRPLAGTERSVCSGDQLSFVSRWHHLERDALVTPYLGLPMHTAQHRAQPRGHMASPQFALLLSGVKDSSTDSCTVDVACSIAVTVEA